MQKIGIIIYLENIDRIFIILRKEREKFYYFCLFMINKQKKMEIDNYKYFTIIIYLYIYLFIIWNNYFHIN